MERIPFVTVQGQELWIGDLRTLQEINIRQRFDDSVPSPSRNRRSPVQQSLSAEDGQSVLHYLNGIRPRRVYPGQVGQWRY